MRLSFLVIGSEQVITVFRDSIPACARTSSSRLQCTASRIASALLTASAGVSVRARGPASRANRSSFFWTGRALSWTAQAGITPMAPHRTRAVLGLNARAEVRGAIRWEDVGGSRVDAESRRSADSHKENTILKAKNTICLWFDKDAQDAARFYAATFPDSQVIAVHKAPGDYPGGKQGDVLTVDFTVCGIPCLGLNGGPEFKHNEAFSFQIATDTQEETDRYWNAIVGNGGKESQCGWCKDRWGLSWQITPRVLTDALAAGGAEAKRAFEAMMPMQKIDIATIEKARRGGAAAV